MTLTRILGFVQPDIHMALDLTIQLWSLSVVSSPSSSQSQRLLYSPPLLTWLSEELSHAYALNLHPMLRHDSEVGSHHPLD